MTKDHNLFLRDTSLLLEEVAAAAAQADGQDAPTQERSLREAQMRFEARVNALDAPARFPRASADLLSD